MMKRTMLIFCFLVCNTRCISASQPTIRVMAGQDPFTGKTIIFEVPLKENEHSQIPQVYEPTPEQKYNRKIFERELKNLAKKAEIKRKKMLEAIDKENDENNQ